MMKHWYKLGAALVAVCLATTAYAQQPELIAQGTQEIQVASTLTGIDFFNIDLTYGYFVRPEVEVKGVGIVTIADQEDLSDQKTYALLAVVDWYILQISTDVMAPYLGVGIGWGRRDFNVGGEDLSELLGTDTDAWTILLEGGVKYFLAPQVALDLAIQYYYAGEEIYTDGAGFSDNKWVIKLALAYLF